MKALFIGGTGTISMAISKLLLEKGWELYLINRGNRNNDPRLKGAHFITVDINDEAAAAAKLEGMTFDVACDFIGFVREQVERDYRLLKGKVKQFMYISSASAYQKPCTNYIISEKTPLANPYWQYSRDKIACEEYLMKLYREEQFPVTIIRPSHTYDERFLPLGVHGEKGSWQVAKRIKEGKPVIIHGDGTSLWTITHNSDFAKGFVGLMGNIHTIGEAIQITSDESVTWNQIYQIVADALGVPLHPVYVSSTYLASYAYFDLAGGLLGDKAHTVVFDCSKLKGFVPEFVATKRADQGLRETVEYILSHPECQTEDPEFDKWCNEIIETMK
ncbi:MAG: NAD-dependent epimerase/dehydratase family protein [Spirochaetaceae bacterium]|nr:NAD-dependent epimerase/dehydratase family protein [Spirochaetaceae bacterium]